MTRIRWAVEVLEPRPADTILEIGCGPGAAAALICPQLTTGRLLAIDRSAVAIARTTKTNAAHIEAGRLELLESTVHDLDIEKNTFDKVFSVNVNLFWTTDPARELTVLKQAMKPGGILHILYGHGPTGADRVTPPIKTALTNQGFVNIEIRHAKHGIGVSARSPNGS